MGLLILVVVKNALMKFSIADPGIFDQKSPA
jgi:hypothetical protein